MTTQHGQRNAIGRMRTTVRAAWALMLGPHAYWLLRSLGSPDARVGQQILLLAACVFFLLKVIDVAFLRVPLTRRGLIACVLLVALLHVGVVDRTLGIDDVIPSLMVPLLAGITFWLTLRLLAVIRRSHLFESLLSELQVGRRFIEWFCATLLLRTSQHYFGALAPGRAPPA